MWQQWCYFNGCHIWHQWHEVLFVHFDVFWCTLHKCSSSMDNYKSTNNWWFAWMVKTPKNKDVVMHAQSKIVLYHYWWCPTRAKDIAMNAQPCVKFIWNYTLWSLVNYLNPSRVHDLCIFNQCTNYLHCVCMHRTAWTTKNVLIFICCWHVLKAWWLHATEKIKDVEMWGAILCDLHDVMYMSMNHNESTEAFKEYARQKMN